MRTIFTSAPEANLPERSQSRGPLVLTAVGESDRISMYSNDTVSRLPLATDKAVSQTIDHRQKTTVMKTTIRKWGIAAMVTLATFLFVNQSTAQTVTLYLQNTTAQPGAGGIVRDLALAQGTSGTVTSNGTTSTSFSETLAFTITYSNLTSPIEGDSYPVSIVVSSVSSSNANYRFRLQRVNSSGTVIASTAYSSTFANSGTRTNTFGFGSVQSWASGDRLRLSIEVASANFTGTSRNITVSTGNTNSFVRYSTPPIVTGTITGSPFCSTPTGGSSVTVPFNSIGTYTAGNVYTAQLSNSSGSFASPTNIGTFASTANTGSISAVIPANTPTGSGYRIRVVSSTPSATGTDNGTNLTVNLATAAVSPAAAQNIGVNANGTTLNVNEPVTPSSRQWFVGVASGGPYSIPTGITASSYTPMFTLQGTYYVVCVSNFACGSVTSNEVQITVSPTITTSAISGSPFCVTPLSGSPVTVNFTSNGSFTGNTYTAQLSDANGSFDSPAFLGNLVSDASGNLSINGTIPAGTPTGSAYRIRVFSSNPASVVTDNLSDLSINLNTVSIAPTLTQVIGIGQNGNTLTATETTTPVSRQWYYGTSPGGPYDQLIAGATDLTYVPNFTSQEPHYVICRTTYACGDAVSNVVQIDVSPTITTGTLTESTFCVTSDNGATVVVPFTADGSFSGNTFTVQLSNALGSFAAPTNIGNLVSDANSGNITATIPANTASFGGYRIRVISSSPAGVYIDNGVNLTITLNSNAVSPTATQNINVGVNGTPITVTESPAAALSREWFYSSSPTGPFTTATGETSTVYTPNFAAQGTYYVVCVSTFSCGTATSSPVQINVAATVTTGAITGSPFCAGASFDVPFTSAGSFTGNTYTVELSNAAGSFTSPVAIGSLVSDANSGLINVTIPANTAAGTGYLVRVVSSNPSVTGSNSGPFTVNRAPAASFVASTTTGTTGIQITFTDQSANTPTSWSWSFPGTQQLTSTDQNPTVMYTSAGTFTATLTASNVCGSGSFSINNIQITALSIPTVFSATNTFIVPPGVSCVMVEAWGGGGKGGQKGTPDGAAGGGGGGAYARSTLNVTPGQTYDVIVGAGSTTTAAGGDSRFRLTPAGSDLVRATGGNSVANDDASGALGGSASTSVGDVKFNGGRGGNVTAGNGGGGGSSAGTASDGQYTSSTNTSTGGTVAGGGNGGAGSTVNDVAGSAGSSPGGGGGGARRNNGTIAGGAGGTGQIRISWVDASNFNMTAPACTDGVTTVTVQSSSLSNGSYTVTYNTTNPSNTGLTATMNFSGGTGTFNTVALAGPVSDIEVTAITFTGWTCAAPITSNNLVSVRLKPTATIAYAGAPFCVTDNSPKPVTVTTTYSITGSYSATPAGLSINSSTGEIDPSLSAVGSYTVSYDFTDGFCTNVATTTVVIGTPPAASFNYAQPSYCQYLTSSPTTLVNPNPVFTGGGVAGTFSALPSGLNFVNVNTGQIDLASSAPGTYTVTNTVTQNGCTTIATTVVTINALPAATISYATPAFCLYSGIQNVSNSAFGAVFGSYSATPAGLTINTANDFSDGNAGQIDPATSTPGTYTVKYTFTDGFCANTATTTVVISTPVNSTVAAAASNVCTGSGTDITVANSSANTSYQLRNNADNSLIGSPVTGTGGTINLPTGTLTASTTFNVLATVISSNCTLQMSVTPTVTVVEQPTAAAGGSITICANGSATVSGATASNGSIQWSHNGAGTLANANTLTPTYTPALADGGTTVTLTLLVSSSPCTAATAIYTINITALPAVTLASSSVCIGSSTALLTPTTGGSWVSNNPAVATVTNDGVVTAISGGTATFTFTDGTTGCTNTTSALTVDPNCQVVTLGQPAQLNATISGDATICEDQTTLITITASGGTPPYKAIYNGNEYTSANAVFTFPVTLSSGLVLNASNVTVTDAHNCTSNTTGSATITVTPASSIVLQSGTASQTVCSGLPVTTVIYALGGTSTGSLLSAGSFPAGLVTGMNGNNFEISGVPTEAGIFNYTITTTGPCPRSVSGVITVLATPIVNFSGLNSAYCVNAAAVTLTGNHSSGTFTGPGVTDNGDGTASFSPSTAGVGVHSITYSFTDVNGCSSSETQIVTVNPLPVVTCPTDLTVCLNAGAMLLSGGFPDGGTYSGDGVSFNVFDPVAAGLGQHLITYTYYDLNGCSSSCSFNITVVELSTVFDSAPITHCGAYQPDQMSVTVTGGMPVDTQNPYFYSWQLLNEQFQIFVDIQDATSSTYQPPVLTPGTYTYRVRIVDLCGEYFTQPKTITVYALPEATISYASNPYCANGTAAVTQTGQAGGTYSSTPGLSINTTTGEIDLGASTPGVYTVTYSFADQHCSNTTTTSVTVNPFPTATISYSGTPYCGLGLAQVSLTGQTGGTFSSSAGLIIDQNTGEINLTNSTPGTYTVIYDFHNDYCSNSTSTTVTILEVPTATISYASPAFCGNGTAAVTQSGQTGGTYSAASGLVIDQNTGTINLSTSTPGTYTVTYTFSNAFCTNTTTTSLTIHPFPQATISYSGSPFCARGTGEVTITGQTGGSFSSTSGLIINPATGAIDLSNSTPGTYVVQYDFANQYCSNSTTTSITINALPTITETVKLSYNGADLTCATATDGQITVTATGLALPLEYSKDNGATYQPSNVFTGLGQGTYHIVVKDANGCVSDEAAVTIVAPEVLNVAQSSVTNVTCFGGNDGAINLGLVTGGTPPYHYVWTKQGDANFFVEGTTPNLPGLTAGTYNYSVTDANNCANVTGTVTITQPIVSFTQTNVDCFGNSTGSATVMVTGAPGPFTFEWRNNVNQLLATNTHTTGEDVMSNLPAGTYHVTVSYSTICSNVVDITITEPAVLSATISSYLDINCISATSGEATVAVTGGTAPYSYLWNDGNHQTTETATGLIAGTYTVTVTDSHNCVTTATVTITQNPPPAISNCPAAPLARNTDAGVCSYMISGTEMDVTATSVCPITYTYTLTGATTLNVNGSLAGVILQKGTTHVVCVVADALQSSTCSFDVVVSDHENPVITCPAAITINCQDSQDPDVNLSLGKATATDNCSLPANITISYSDVSLQDPNPLVAAHYNYTITRTWKATDEAGNFSTCIQVITVHDITAPTNIVIPADVNVQCADAVPPANDAAVTADDNCSPVTVTHEDVIINQTCVNRFVLQRTYTVTDVAGNSDTKMQTITVFDDIVPVISSCPPDISFCYSVTEQYSIATLLASDNCSSFNVSYSISGATTRSGTGNDASGLFNIGVSTISWTVTDLCGNTSTCSTNVTVYPIPPTPVVTVVNNCSSSTLSTNAAGSLLWSTGATTSSITVNTPGTYTVTSTINGCTSPAGSAVADPIFVPATPVVTVVNNCDGTSVLSTDAPGTLHWSTGATGPSITVFTGGTYSVTQSNSCYTSAPGFGVAAPTFGANAPVVSITQPSCSNPAGSILIVSPTNSGLTFSIDGQNYQSSPLFTGLTPGTYYVSVKTLAGCTSPATPATLNAQPSTPAIPVVTVVNNCDGTSTLSTTASGTLLWSTGASGSTITVINGGSYSVTQTVNGCTSLPGSAVAAPNTTPIAPILSVTQPNCTTATGSILVMVPTGSGLTYSIDGQNYQSSPLFSGLAPDSYNVTVRNSGGCTSTASLAVILPGPTVPSTPVVTVVNNCNGTSTLSTTASGSLLWSTGATSPTILVNNAGTYSVTQTVNGCTSAPGFGTAAPGFTPTTPVLSVVQPNCTTSTGSITVIVPTGSGLTYSINGTDYQSSPVFAGLAPNGYLVTVMSASGCVSNAVSAVILPGPTVPATPVVTVVNNCDGTSILSTTATGNLLWSTGASGSFIVVITGGPFSVTQTVNGCTSLPGIGVAAPNATPAPPTVVLTQTNCNSATGTITVTAPSGAGWTYSIDGDNYQTSTVFAGLNPGNYNVTAKSPAGCVSSITAATINAQPVTPNAPTVGTITQPNCTTTTGSVVLSGLPAGNWTIFPGNISGNSSSITISNLAPATYNFTVTTAAGCSSLPTQDVVITQPLTAPSAPVVGTVTQPTCSTATGNVVLGGLPAGNWTINPGNITGNTPGVVITGLTPDSYNFTVTNENGCISVASANVTINPQPATPTAPVVGLITPPTCSVATGSVVLSGLPAGSWTIQPGNISGNSSSVTINNLAPGTHTFNVTNSSGCTSLASADVVISAQPLTPTAPVIGTITQPTCAVATGSVILTGLPSGTWTINPGGITGSGTTTTISNLAPDSYNFTVTNETNCTSVSSLNVTINPAPATPTAPIVGTIVQPTCLVATGSVVLSGLPAGSWTIYPGGIAGNSSSITISNLAPGSYNFTVVNSAGCTSVATGDVVINVQPTPPAPPVVGTITQPTVSVPTGNVVLSGLPSGTWTINPGSITGSGSSTTVSGLAPGSYNFTVTNSVNCTSQFSANIVINSLVVPSAPLVGQITQPTCAVATGTIVLNGLPSTGNWTLTRNPGNVTTNGSGSSFLISGLAPGLYTYTVTNSGGTSDPSAQITINLQPVAPTVAAITGTTTVCVGSSTQLSDITAGGVWSVVAGTGSASINSSGLVTGLTAGTVTVNYTVTTPCGTAVATTTVTVSPVPTATITYASAAPANQMLALPMNEGTGTTTADISGRSHPGTLTSAPTWIAGRYGQGLNLNGTSSYVNIADHADFTLTPSQNYTWSAWVRNTNFNQWSTVFSQTLNANTFFYIYAHSSTDAEAGPVTNGISVYWYNGTNRLVVHSNNNVLTANTWSHIAVTYNGAAAQANRFTIYVNGVNVTNTGDIVSAGTLAAIDPTNIRVGSNQPFGEYLNGAVDEVRYYNRLLTAGEITTDMNTALAAPSNGTFCPTGTANVTQTGQAGGTYSSTPGLSINNSTGAINLAASTPGNYVVTYSFASGGCNGTATANVVIAGQATSISYAGGPFCQSGTAAVTIAGQTGGTFASTAGLSINASTGAINLATSTAGTYTVTYNYGSSGCTGSATTTVTIVATTPTSISYAGSPFCQNGTALVTITGQTGGSFSSTAGLSIDNNTGAINLTTSTVGTYTVTYNYSNGNCGGSATTTVTINAVPTAAISYANGPFCQNGTATVTLSGQTGGSFTASPTGLSINATTGAINLAASAAGVYTVTYNFGSGSCSNSTTTTVTVTTGPVASISYAGGPFCTSGSVSVTQTGQANGTYSAAPAGLSINNTTGAINLAASAPGTYTVTYSFTNGVCGATATTTVVVNSLPTATIAYTPPAPAGLMMALPMNEGTGTTTADISGRAHPGTLTNTPTWIAGRYGQGLGLNGTSSYVNIPDHADFTLTPTLNYTWSAWVRNNNFNQWSTVFSETIDANNFFYFYAHSSTDAEAGPVTNGVSVYWYNGANKIVIHSNNNVLTANNWAHIAVTYNGATGVTAANRFTIFINGVDVTNRTDVVSAGTLAALNPTNIRIGSNQPFGEFLNGSVDEVRFYNRLLTGAEITSDMNTALTPANGSFCQSLGTATVTQTGTTGGSYSAPAGVSINPATGVINLAASTPGTYTIAYTFGSGACINTTSTSITIVNCNVVARVINNPVNTTNSNNLAVVPGNLSMTVFPNPTLTYFNLRVKSNRSETVEVKVYDMLGRVVQQDRGAPQQTFRLGDRLAAGIYVVEALQAGEKVSQKVIKKADGEINFLQ